MYVYMCLYGTCHRKVLLYGYATFTSTDLSTAARMCIADNAYVFCREHSTGYIKWLSYGHSKNSVHMFGCSKKSPWDFSCRTFKVLI